jgi:hypothetical protein
MAATERMMPLQSPLSRKIRLSDEVNKSVAVKGDHIQRLIRHKAVFSESLTSPLPDRDADARPGLFHAGGLD